MHNVRPQSTLLGMQEYFAITSMDHTKRSNVAYLKVMDAVADTKDTIITVLQV